MHQLLGIERNIVGIRIQRAGYDPPCPGGTTLHALRSLHDALCHPCISLASVMVGSLEFIDVSNDFGHGYHLYEVITLGQFLHRLGIADERPAYYDLSRRKVWAGRRMI